jgi:hypothetical protein
MRKNVNRIYAIILVSLFFSAAFCFASISKAGTIASPATITSGVPYNPWIDVNNDGKINVLDLIAVVLGLGSSGTPVQKAKFLF